MDRFRCSAPALLGISSSLPFTRIGCNHPSSKSLRPVPVQQPCRCARRTCESTLCLSSFLLALRYLTDGEDVRDVWSDFIPKTQALLGETLFLQKNYAEAWNYLEKAERYYRSYFSEDKYSKAITEYCLAEINLHYGDYDVAMRYFSSAAPNLECQFHPEHGYCRCTAEMLGPDREIESNDTLEFAQKSANDFIAGLIESDSQVDDCKSTIAGWIQYAEESFAKGTPRWTFEAYVSLNHALSLTTLRVTF
ncbi:MAG TPA: tetratricopeptide repeat protein [Candidatus Melainabacteria bacterium]|nr:tetratricopeptide repeat protein [Candidatus Melainabacteria bacterium]